MEVTQWLRVGLGSAVGLNPQYSHLVSTTTKTQAFMQKSTIPGDSQECQKQEFHKHGKTAHGKFLDGNGQSTNDMKKSVAQQ